MREFEMLARVYDANAALPASVTIPPGDDMGALRLGSEEVLVTVDQVADGVHVDVATTSLERIGRKAVTRNLSDVAAMGAIPVGAVVAASLPRDFGKDRTLKLFEAMRNVAQSYDCPLFGGDISMWDGRLLLTVTVLAQPVPGTRPILRHGARVGDIICVTGELGGSLQDVQGRIHHLDFQPRLKLGQQMAQSPAIRPSAMIDLSDGLARDITHLLPHPGITAGSSLPSGISFGNAPSSVTAPVFGARIDLHHLPISQAARQAAEHDGKSVWQHALTDGEDYELCFTIAPKKLPELLKASPDVTITPIGEIIPTHEVVFCDQQGDNHTFQASGWEHQGR